MKRNHTRSCPRAPLSRSLFAAARVEIAIPRSDSCPKCRVAIAFAVARVETCLKECSRRDLPLPSRDRCSRSRGLKPHVLATRVDVASLRTLLAVARVETAMPFLSPRTTCHCFAVARVEIRKVTPASENGKHHRDYCSQSRGLCRDRCSRSRGLKHSRAWWSRGSHAGRDRCSRSRGLKPSLRFGREGRLNVAIAVHGREG